MTTPRKRLPQDSVVSSLSEIQSILRDDHARPASPPKVTLPTAESGGPARLTANVDVALVGEVPDASQVDAERRARWATVERPLPGRATTSRPWRILGAVGVGAALLGLGAFVLFRDTNVTGVPSAVTSAAEPASAPPIPTAAPPSARPSVAAPLNTGVSVAPASAAPTTPTPSRKAARSPARKAPKRKVDRQFDDVLDGL
jgi:hypothetical protein